MFHAGHIRILEMAKQRGDYLIVGVHNDAVVNKQYGSNYPILNMQVCTRFATRLAKDLCSRVLDAPVSTEESILGLCLLKLFLANFRHAYFCLCMCPQCSLKAAYPALNMVGRA